MGDDPAVLAVETIPDGQAQEIGVVVEARLPPVATAVSVAERTPANVSVMRSFTLPAGGPMEVEARYKVDVDVCDDLVPPSPGCRIRVVFVEEDHLALLPPPLRLLEFRSASDEFGPLDREIFYCGDPGCVFAFGDLRLEPEPWPPALLEARRLVARACGVSDPTLFTACLVNRFRRGQGSIPFHVDEVRAHSPPLVATLSLGGPRLFRLRVKKQETRSWYSPPLPLNEAARTTEETPPPLVLELLLEAGAVVLMEGPGAHSLYEHELPLRGPDDPERISLTFRPIVPGFEDAKFPPSSSSFF
mmetsp:Transcript_38621/g.123800  ORF Transcript_38621/g.123800 Transcript_38621/m.123800 type:complete len:303 (+) Transcript_38621:82-990(+)